MTRYVAVVAAPGEQQDPTLNPSRGPLGWIVADSMTDRAVPVLGGYTYMERPAAEKVARRLSDES